MQHFHPDVIKENLSISPKLIFIIKGLDYYHLFAQMLLQILMAFLLYRTKEDILDRKLPALFHAVKRNEDWILNCENAIL